MTSPEQIYFYDVNFTPEEARFNKQAEALRVQFKSNQKTMTQAKVINAHKYELQNKENPHQTPAQVITFCKEERKAEGGKEISVIHNGTTDVAVAEVLIERVKFHISSKDMKSSSARKKLDNAYKQLQWARDNIQEALSK